MRKLNKKTILGSIMITFIATVIIVIILGLFVLGSTIYKKFANINGEVEVRKGNQVGIENIDDYMSLFKNLVEARTGVICSIK